MSSHVTYCWLMTFQTSVIQFNNVFPLISSPSYKQQLCLSGRRKNMQFYPKSFVYLEFLSKVLSVPSSPEVVCLIHQTCYWDVGFKMVKWWKDRDCMSGKQLVKDSHSGYSPVNVSRPQGPLTAQSETGTLRMKHRPTSLQLEVTCPSQIIMRTYAISLK